MKISYRTHPVLGLINGDKEEVRMDEQGINSFRLLTGLNYVFREFRERLNKNVIVVSKPFQEASVACVGKMINSELYKEIGDELCGVLLFGGISVIYLAKRKTINEVGAWELNIIEFYAGNCLKTFCWDGIVNYTQKNIDNETPDFASKSIWHFVQMILMFKKFAQIEIKELKAGQKIKGIDCNYKNDTKSNVTILDSKWFTTLVKSDAFKVRGHFRLQPKKKNGEWTKELIWINEFEKHGYAAPARKIKEYFEI